MGDDETIAPELQAATKEIYTELGVHPMALAKRQALATALSTAWFSGMRDRMELRKVAILALERWIHEQGHDGKA